jgi:hypothetical protein
LCQVQAVVARLDRAKLLEVLMEGAKLLEVPALPRWSKLAIELHHQHLRRRPFLDQVQDRAVAILLDQPRIFYPWILLDGAYRSY